MAFTSAGTVNVRSMVCAWTTGGLLRPDGRSWMSTRATPPRRNKPRNTRIKGPLDRGSGRNDPLYTHSDGLEQGQRKPGALVNPLIPLCKACAFHELLDSRGLVLVRTLRPDGLALLERDVQVGVRDVNVLQRQADQVHLHPRRVTIPHGAVRKSVQIEVGLQLGVEPQQEVLVEGGRQAQRIVIREQQLTLRLDQVRPEQQVIVRAKRPPDQAKKGGRAGRVEVADVRPQECYQRGAAIVGRQAEQPILVG